MSRVKLLGVDVDAVTIDDLHSLITRSVVENRRWVIANHNSHSVYLYHHDAKMRKLYEQAQCVHVDGMALIFVAKILGFRLGREHRITYVDWIRPLMSKAAHQGFRVFYLGSAPNVVERGSSLLRNEFPNLQIAAHHGYFRVAKTDPENLGVLATIAAFRPDILIVGMGMPRQEHWIVDNLEEIHAHAILTAGACMDYVAGFVTTPPRWMGRFGLEWIYRLWQEPSRLWRRYLLEPWFLLPLFARQFSRRQ